MPLAAGTRLGAYEILSALGAGGMGEVYRARDTRLQRDIALKVLPELYARDPERVQRLEHEALATASLNHPNILAVYDIGAHNGTTFVVSELLEGETLRDVLRGGPLPPRRAVEYGIDIARGLAAAHDRGIAHRDLKPENVFVTADRRVKILDFGLAKLLQPIAEPAGPTIGPGATAPGLVLGTPGYMAPEQLRGQPVDHRADIFAFGVILYEMLSGQRAFAGQTPADAISAILNSEPPDLVRPVPVPLERTVRRCLEKDPRDRFQSARDLAFALETMGGSSGVSGPVSGAVVVRRRRWQRPAAAAALVLAGLIVGAVATRLLGRDAPAVHSRVSLLPPDDVVVTGSLAVSPDGRSVAFTGTAAESVSALWVRRLDTAEARLIPGTEHAWAPFWSPDSRSVAFFAAGSLKRVDLAGGPARTIAGVTDPRGGTWNADGLIVFAPHPDDGLYTVPAEGGALARLTSLDAERQEVSHRWPHFLPDGRHVLFMNRSATGQGRLAIYGISIEAPGTMKRIVVARSGGLYSDGRLLFLAAKTVLAQRFDPATLAVSGDPVPLAEDVWFDPNMDGLNAFSAAGGSFVFRSGRGGDSRFVLFDRTGKRLDHIGPPNAAGPAFSPDGRLLAFSLTDPEENSDRLWLLDLARGSAAHLTATPRNDTSPVWSPDGRRIIFSSDRAGTFNLYERSIGGPATDREMLKAPGWQWPRSWSPDGRTLLFDQTSPATRSDIWMLPLDHASGTPGAAQPVAFVSTEADECCGRFSPDGRWVAYMSTESGRQQVYVRPFPRGEERWQVSTDGGHDPAWTAGGRELVFLSHDSRLMAVKVSTTGGRFEAPMPVPLFHVRARPKTNLTDWSFVPMPAGDRFLVSELITDVRTSTLHLHLNWPSASK
jgi:eukaryotic-like serine/threonine-protein kinase